MNCEKARQIAASRGFLKGLLARRHVKSCAECRQWFAEADKTAEFLKRIPPHPLPDGLLQRLKETPTPDVSVSIGRTKETRMKKVALVFAVLMVIGGIVFAAAFVTRPHFNLDDVREALSKVNTVHMTFTDEQVDPETGKTTPILTGDKWIRQEPFFLYEHQYKLVPGLQPESYLIVTRDTESSCMYFPTSIRDRAFVNRNPGAKSLTDEILNFFTLTSPFDPNAKTEPAEIKTLDGRKMILVKTPTGGVVTVDVETNLPVKYYGISQTINGKTTKYREFDIKYGEMPPEGVFDWQPPADVEIVDKRK